MPRFPFPLALRPFEVLALLTIASNAHAWPQIPSQNVGLGAQSAYTDHGNAACADGLGGTFIAWTDVRGPQHVYVQHLDATGAVVAGWPTGGVDVSPSDTSPWAQCDVLGIYPCGAGSAIVAWVDWDIPWVSHSPFWAQRVADPSAGGPILWTPGGVQATPHLYNWDFNLVQAAACAGDDHSVFIAYTVDGSYTTVQKFREDGTRAFGLWGSDAHYSDFYWDTDSPDWNPRPAPDGLGGAFVVWEDGRDGYNYETAVQHVDANGDFVAGWPDDGHVLSIDPYYDGPSWRPNAALSRVAPDGLGGAIVTWDDFLSGPNGSLSGQRVAADGTRLWDHLATGGTAYAHFWWNEKWTSQHEMCTDGAGGAYYARSDQVARLIHLHSDGYDDWDLNLGSTIGSYGTKPDVIPDGLGGALVAWEAQWTAGGSDIEMQHVDVHGNLLQGEDAPLLTDDAYDQHSAKLARDGGIGGIASWIDTRPATYEALPALAPLEGSPANATAPGTRRKSSGRRNGQATSYSPSRVSTGPGMFAQQVNSIGVLGGDVIHTYTAGVGPDLRPDALAVLGGAPNPAVGRMRIAFQLPGNGPATLEVMDVAGRRVWSSEVGGLGAGRHVADLGSTRGGAPGLYFVRLRQNGRAATGKVLLAR